MRSKSTPFAKKRNLEYTSSFENQNALSPSAFQKNKKLILSAIITFVVCLGLASLYFSRQGEAIGFSQIIPKYSLPSDIKS